MSIRLYGCLVLALLAFIGNQFGSVYRYPEIGTAVLFPPYAILTAFLVVSPRRDWVWYILVAGIAHLVTHWPQWSLSWVLMADVANLARALTAALLLGWFFSGPPRLDNIRHLAQFLAASVIAAPAVGATLGAATVMWHGGSVSWFEPWRAWFMSNALTGLTLLPALTLALVGLLSWRRERGAPKRAGEALTLACCLALTCWVAFLSGTPRIVPATVLLYTPLPVLIWAALRFGPGAVSVALSVVAFVAIAAADRAVGPFVAITKDGAVLTLQLLVLLTSLPMLCIAAVNTERQRAIQLHRALLASLQDHVAMLDARGVVLEVNRSWRQYVEAGEASPPNDIRAGDNYAAGWEAAATRGSPCAPGALAGVKRVLDGEQRRYEVEYDCDRGGEPARYALTVEALERPEGGAVVMRSDISARRREQLELEEQRRELSHLARVAVLGQLTGALAHELNQPLASILANTEAARYLLEHEPHDLAELGTILTDIAAADVRAVQVIQRLRALLKRGETRMRLVCVGEVVNEVLQLAHADMVSRQVTATTLIEPDLPEVLADRVQLQQVLLNLILNGCEAMTTTPESDRSLLLRVSADADGAVNISVRDRGTGIPASVISRIFQPFVTSKPQGLGLGLSISRTIIVAHGGRLRAENNEGGGATLHCVLPATNTVSAASTGTAAGVQNATQLLEPILPL